MSDFVRKAAIERIEGELDFGACEEAKAELDVHPVTVFAAVLFGSAPRLVAA